MWKPSINFITLHYAYIITFGFLGLIVLYPYGNLRAIDAYFFGVSAATESGLNTVDVNELKTYQQLFIYFVPIITNLGFINILVVVVRLHWFEKRLKEIAPTALRAKSQSLKPRDYGFDLEAHIDQVQGQSHGIQPDTTDLGSPDVPDEDNTAKGPEDNTRESNEYPNNRSVSFANGAKALYIPSPREQDRGLTIREIDENGRTDVKDDDSRSEIVRHRLARGLNASGAPLERVASSMFMVGRHPSRTQGPKLQNPVSLSKDSNLPGLSSQATIGRNSQFYNLTAEDRERLGGAEYQSLKLLLKIVIGYFFGLHLFGAICLVGWIQYAEPKYRDYLQECGQGSVWWAFYSAQSMVDNLGFTLTPDSMISFQDATFPMIVMSFLAYAGNTLYPCVLRLVIWVIYKCVSANSSLKEPLDFLLKYPRRCYTLLFRSKPTWILFGIIFVLNFVDVLLIVLLDLDNPAVNNLPAGPRVLASIFQAASSRHTGTSTFNLGDVNPAVQLSLLVMMYIAIFPIAISVRASNIYEESTLGVYSTDHDLDEDNSMKYVLAHVQNQLSFDLWYIFLGIFCICISESARLMDDSDPRFSVFAIFFEVASAYGNVGLSLGYPTVNTSLSGKFNVFSKVVICLMMIRGRHRGLPYRLDRAILLPDERLVEDHHKDTMQLTLHGPPSADQMDSQLLKVKRYHTK